MSAQLCKYCGGDITIRNPTGKCDHLYWPKNLTDEAKRTNGLQPAIEPLIQKVISIIHAHENDLSDGYQYYGEEPGVRRLAEEIVKEICR